MTLTTEALARYLGAPSALLLSEAPFRDWQVDRTVETDLEPNWIDYVFPGQGIEIQADARDRVAAVFLSPPSAGLDGIGFSHTRAQLRDRLGPASKSGEGLRDPILGDYGPWDRFSNAAYTLHIEFRADADRVAKITLMRADVVPA